MKTPQIGIIGYAGLEEYPKGTKISPKVFKYAYQLGKLCAQQGWTVVTGGKSGIMEQASKGAKACGGLSVGVVTGNQRGTSNPYVDVEVASGMYSTGEEVVLVSMCDALIVLGGGAGTLQELSMAYRTNKPIIIIKNLGGWSQKLESLGYLDERQKQPLLPVSNPQQAINTVSKLLIVGATK